MRRAEQLEPPGAEAVGTAGAARARRRQTCRRRRMSRWSPLGMRVRRPSEKAQGAAVSHWTPQSAAERKAVQRGAAGAAGARIGGAARTEGAARTAGARWAWVG